METTAPRWKCITTLPDGHRLFQGRGFSPLRTAIADSSGRTPGQTDDGVLWLDHNRPLIAAVGLNCIIPLVTTDGEKTSTPSNMQTLLILAVQFRWEILGAYGQTYTVKVNASSDRL